MIAPTQAIINADPNIPSGKCVYTAPNYETMTTASIVCSHAGGGNNYKFLGYDLTDVELTITDSGSVTIQNSKLGPGNSGLRYGARNGFGRLTMSGTGVTINFLNNIIDGNVLAYGDVAITMPIYDATTSSTLNIKGNIIRNILRPWFDLKSVSSNTEAMFINFFNNYMQDIGNRTMASLHGEVLQVTNIAPQGFDAEYNTGLQTAGMTSSGQLDPSVVMLYFNNTPSPATFSSGIAINSNNVLIANRAKNAASPHRTAATLYQYFYFNTTTYTSNNNYGDATGAGAIYYYRGGTIGSYVSSGNVNLVTGAGFTPP